MEPVVVRITNLAGLAINLGTNPVAVTSGVSGVNPEQFSNVVIASGTLSTGSYQDVQVRGAYNMAAPGEYRFVATTNVTGDGDLLNDAMTTQVIRYQGGTAAAEPTTVCSGLPVELTVPDTSLLTSVWNVSTNNGQTWTPVSAEVSTFAPFLVFPQQSALYRTSSCLDSEPVAVTVTSCP